MSLLAARDATSSAPVGVITVADLLSRYSPAAVEPEPEPDTEPVSVQTLLRREGHLTGAAAAELDVTEYVDDGGMWDDEPRRGPSRGVVTRGALAAGVLLAAGSALGMVVTATGTPEPVSDDHAVDQTPSRPGLDQPLAAVPALGPTAAGGALDAGEAVDREWMDAAFPRTTSEATTPTSARSAPAPTGSSSAPTTTSGSSLPAERGTGAPSTTGPEADEDDGSGSNGGAGAEDKPGKDDRGGGNSGGEEEEETGLVYGMVDGLADTVAGLL